MNEYKPWPFPLEGPEWVEVVVVVSASATERQSQTSGREGRCTRARRAMATSGVRFCDWLWLICLHAFPRHFIHS